MHSVAENGLFLFAHKWNYGYTILNVKLCATLSVSVSDRSANLLLKHRKCMQTWTTERRSADLRLNIKCAVLPLVSRAPSCCQPPSI